MAGEKYRDYFINNLKKLLSLKGQVRSTDFTSNLLGTELAASLFSRAAEVLNLPLNDLPFYQGIGGRGWLTMYRSIEDFRMALDKQNITDDQFDEKGRDIIFMLEDLILITTPYLTLSSKEFLNFDQAEKDAHNALAGINKAKEDALKAAEIVEQIATESSVARFAINFSQRARKHAESANIWLAVSVVLGILSLIVSFCILGKEGLGTSSLIARIGFVTMFYFITFWCGKNYKVHSHLAVINQHRHDALSTFETFIKSAGNQDIKDAVLLETTRCIFSPSISGYLSKEPDPSPVIELINGVARSGQ